MVPKGLGFGDLIHQLTSNEFAKDETVKLTATITKKRLRRAGGGAVKILNC